MDDTAGQASGFSPRESLLQRFNALRSQSGLFDFAPDRYEGLFDIPEVPEEPEAWLDEYVEDDNDGTGTNHDSFWRDLVPEGGELWRGEDDGGKVSANVSADGGEDGAEAVDDDDTEPASGAAGEVPRDALEPRDAVLEGDGVGPEPPSGPDGEVLGDGDVLDSLMDEIGVILEEEGAEEEYEADYHPGGRASRELSPQNDDILADHPGGRYFAGGGSAGEMAVRMRSIFRFLSDRLGREISGIFHKVIGLRDGDGDVDEVASALEDVVHRIEDVEALISALDGLTRDDDDLKVTNLAHVRLYMAYCLNLRRSGRRETIEAAE